MFNPIIYNIERYRTIPYPPSAHEVSLEFGRYISPVWSSRCHGLSYKQSTLPDNTPVGGVEVLSQMSPD